MEKLKIEKIPITQKNRFGHIMTFTKYRSKANIRYLINLMNKLNKHGKKALE